MSKYLFTTLCLAAPLVLAACGGGQDEPGGEQATEQAGSGDTADTASTQPPPADVAQAETPAALAQCIACHSFDKDGVNKIGPNLWGVHGQAAASKSGFAYSKAMMDSGLTWDDATLDAYIENPRKTVPGGKMSYAGMRNADQRKEVVAYLQTLSDGE